jgi:hypothetical protein
LISLIFLWGIGPPGSRKGDHEKQGSTNLSSSGDGKTKENGSIASEKSVDDPET